MSLNLLILLLGVILSAIITNAFAFSEDSNNNDVTSSPNYLAPEEFEIARLSHDMFDNSPVQTKNYWTLEAIAEEEEYSKSQRSESFSNPNRNLRRRRRSISYNNHSNQTDFNFSEILSSEIVKTPEEIDYEEKIEIWKEKRWPNRRVPYTLHSSLNSTLRIIVAAAIQDYHDKTCIRFVPKEPVDTNYVEIMKNDSVACGRADICVKGERQTANFGGNCLNRDTMIHELGHTLCLNHEHARPDRSKYIELSGVCMVQLVTSGYHDWLTDDLFYDYLSNLHYGVLCKENCIVPKIPGVTKCNSESLSILDVEKLNALYECPGCKSYRFRPTSKLFKTTTEDLTLNDYLLWHTTFFGLGNDKKKENLFLAGKNFDGEMLYVCRAYHNGDIIPGHGNILTRSCQVTNDGKVYEKTKDFEILTVPQNNLFKFTEIRLGSTFPSNAIPGGRTANGTTLYVGICSQSNAEGKQGIFPGKVSTSSSMETLLYFAYGEEEKQCSSLSVLVCNEENA